jgi:hypothetical protein
VKPDFSPAANAVVVVFEELAFEDVTFDEVAVEVVTGSGIASVDSVLWLVGSPVGGMLRCLKSMIATIIHNWRGDPCHFAQSLCHRCCLSRR